jgi:hypothetical protein
MESNNQAAAAQRDLDSRWRQREAWWQGKLGRLRLGVEPLEEQLARYRRVTWALTIVPGFIAAVLVSLFAAFGRADIGFVVILILFLPIVAREWLDHVILTQRARCYREERANYLREKENLASRTRSADTRSNRASGQSD